MRQQTPHRSLHLDLVEWHIPQDPRDRIVYINVLHIVWDRPNVAGSEKKRDNLAGCEGEEVEKDFQHVSLDQNIRVL